MEPVIGKIIDLYKFVRLGLRRDSAPQREKSGEHLNPQRKTLPGHVHTASHRRDEFGAPIDTLHICRIEVAVSRVPAIHPYLLSQSLGLRRETIMVLRTPKPLRKFGGCTKVFEVKAI